MTKKVIKKNRDNRSSDEDGFRKQSLNQIRSEKESKKNRNFDNALKSKNLNRIVEFDDEELDSNDFFDSGTEDYQEYLKGKGA